MPSFMQHWASVVSGRLWLRSVTITSLIAVISISCASRPVTSGAKLKDAVRSYNELQRWGQWQAAVRYVSPEKSAKWLEARHKAGPVRIADVQILHIAPTVDSKAVITVRMSWYRMPEMRLLTKLQTQIWKEEAAGWMIIDESEQAAAGQSNWP